MTTIIAFVSQKGGVGKSTLSRALGREAAKSGLTTKIADLDTQQGTGTFVADRKVEYSKDERERMLGQLVGEFVSRAGAAGFTLKQLMKALKELQPDEDGRESQRGWPFRTRG